MFTNTMRFTGLSGIDTATMVQQLMKAESLRYTKLQQKTQLLSWQQESYRAQSANLRTFKSSILDIMSPKSILKTSNFSSSKITALVNGQEAKHVNVLSSNTASGTYDLIIKQLAQSDRWQSNKEISGKFEGEDPISISNLKAGDRILITLDGEAKTIQFTQADIDRISKNQNNNDEFVTVLNEHLTKLFGPAINGNSKISASINSSNKLSFSTASGHSAIINELPRTINASGKDIKRDLLSENKSKFSLTVNNSLIEFELDKNMTDDQIVNTINSMLSEKNLLNSVRSSLLNGKVSFSASNTNDAIIISGDALELLGFDSDITLEHTNVLKDLGIANNTSSNLDMNATLESVFGNSLNVDMNGMITFTINQVEFKFDKTDTINDMLREVNRNGSGVKMSYNNMSKNFTLEATHTGITNKIDFGSSSDFLTNTLGLTNVQQAQDSIFVFDGIETSRSSNSIDINNLRMELREVNSNGEVIKISVTSDIEKSKDVIKNFVEEYNKLIDLLQKQVNTNRPRDAQRNLYEPLTSEQRAAMSDSQIKDWEEKAKTGLLYNDSIIKDVLSQMRSMLYEPVQLSDGTSMSIFELGITTTMNFNDGGKLQIDEEKLNKSIETRGNLIGEFFANTSNITDDAIARRKQQGIGERLNDIVNRSLSNNGAFARKAGLEASITSSNNTLSIQIKQQNEQLVKMLEYLQRKESNYYAVFTRMEQAVMKNNNQISALQSQLGL